MPASTKTVQGPLATAAAALEEELGRYEETASELKRSALTSDKTLQRARKVLEECAGHQEKLATLLPAFAQAMQAAQARQQQCMDATAEGTARIKARFEERMALLERVAALGQRTQDLNEPVAAVISGKDENRSVIELLKSLEDVGTLTEAVIAEAEAVHEAAQDGDWQDIARDTEALKQQLQSARNKVLVAQKNIAARAPS